MCNIPFPLLKSKRENNSQGYVWLYNWMIYFIIIFFGKMHPYNVSKFMEKKTLGALLIDLLSNPPSSCLTIYSFALWIIQDLLEILLAMDWFSRQIACFQLAFQFIYESSIHLFYSSDLNNLN